VSPARNNMTLGLPVPIILLLYIPNQCFPSTRAKESAL
jgi:hypothetical protein